MYKGLTPEDKPELDDAKARGAEWVANDADGSTYWYTDKPVRLDNYPGRWDNPTGEYGRVKHDLKIGYDEPVNINLALAQIAEMEAERKPMTVNEWLNQATPEQKAEYLLYFRPTDSCFNGTELEGKPCYMALDGSFRKTAEEAIDANKKWLNNPHTEGATK